MRLIISFLFLLFSFTLLAKPKAPIPVSKYDSGTVSLRKFDDAALREYAKNPDFNYGETRRSLDLSWIERFWRWFWNLFPDVDTRPVKNYNWVPIIKFFLWAFGISMVLFAIIKLSGIDFRLIFMGKAKQVDLPFEESLENIHQISFDDEVENAIRNKDYRLAVRLLYLKSLKGLNDAGRIKWEPDKTNSQYVNELKHAEQKKQFRYLTRQFEYAWYGGFEISKESFSSVSENFRNFNPVMR